MASWGGATRPLLLQPQSLCWMTQACGRSKLGSTKDRQRHFQCEVRNLPSRSTAVAHFLALMHIKSVHSQSTLLLWKESRDDPLEGNLVSSINGLKFLPPSLSQMTVLWVLIRIHTEVRVTYSYVIPALGRGSKIQCQPQLQRGQPGIH